MCLEGVTVPPLGLPLDSFFFSFRSLTNFHDSLLKNPLLTLKMRGFRASYLIISHKVFLTHGFKMAFAFRSKESLWISDAGVRQTNRVWKSCFSFCFGLHREEVRAMNWDKRFNWRERKGTAAVLLDKAVDIFHQFFMVAAMASQQSSCIMGPSQRAAFQSHDSWSCPAGLLSSNQSPDR